MTKEEIKASIAANIAGQFNQVDISGKLAGILEGIVDLIPGPYDLTGLGEISLEYGSVDISDDLAKKLTSEISIKYTANDEGLEIVCSQITDKGLMMEIARDQFQNESLLCLWGTMEVGADGVSAYDLVGLVTGNGTYYLQKFEF